MPGRARKEAQGGQGSQGRASTDGPTRAGTQWAGTHRAGCKARVRDRAGPSRTASRDCKDAIARKDKEVHGRRQSPSGRRPSHCRPSGALVAPDRFFRCRPIAARSPMCSAAHARTRPATIAFADGDRALTWPEAADACPPVRQRAARRRGRARRSGAVARPELLPAPRAAARVLRDRGDVLPGELAPAARRARVRHRRSRPGGRRVAGGGGRCRGAGGP